MSIVRTTVKKSCRQQRLLWLNKSNTRNVLLLQWYNPHSLLGTCSHLITDSEDGAWLPPPQIYELSRLALLSPADITLARRQEQMKHVRRLAPQLIFANDGIVVSALNGHISLQYFYKELRTYHL